MNTDITSNQPKRQRPSTYLAWTLFAAIMLVVLFFLVRGLLDRPAGDEWSDFFGELLFASVPTLFAFLAALIVTYRPRNPIGWLMMLTAILITGMGLAENYLALIQNPPAEPTVILLVSLYLAGAGWMLLIFPFVFTMLLFPNGRLLSPRWRWVLWTGLAMLAMQILGGFAVETYTLYGRPDWEVQNPIGFMSAETSIPFLILAPALVIITVLSLASLVIRYRRSVGVEREQIKWVLYAFALFAAVGVPSILFFDLPFFNQLSGILFPLAIMSLPVAITIAILRYRLYDIDVIIRRTLIYGLLTIVLAGIYFGSILLLQAIFSAVSSQQSPVAIVISTLVIAALFNPLRSRVQEVIDRRFFRSKYDAAHTLEQFALTARDEVNLEQLTSELVQVVQETMQPENVTLWLKERD